jgi:2',5'-phosphodiesterase
LNKTFEELLPTFEKNSDEFCLKINESCYQLRYNWPTINQLTLPTSILAGFFIYPSKCDLDYANKHCSEFLWFKGKLPNSKKENEIVWEEVGRGFCFLVRSEDIGYRIKVIAIPKSHDGSKTGIQVEAIAKNEVQAGPGYCPFEERQLYTEKRLSGKDLRVVSYNILADYYADSEDGRTKLFNYCAQYAIDIDYRKQLLIKEIVGYNADILCMQEVDFKVFDLDLIPFLEERNMSGIHNKKGTTPEGLATFYRTDRFELIESHGLNIGEAAKNHEACKELFGKLQSNEALVSRFTDLGTTLQLALIRMKEFPEKLIFIANTHLYFHPDADHIRLLQIGFSMILVEDFIKKFKQTCSTNDISLIFCGDFNSVPECGIYKLMTEGHVPDDFVDWRSNEEQAVKNVHLQQPFAMQSACGILKYTNYTIGFKECIDYIFCQVDKFNVTKVVEIPSEHELELHNAIPSVTFPSDHIAIIAELELKNC